MIIINPSGYLTLNGLADGLIDGLRVSGLDGAVVGLVVGVKEGPGASVILHMF